MQQQGGERASPSVLWKVATYLDRSASTGGGLLWVTGGKTPSEYIFSELPQVADIARRAFHDLVSPLVSQIMAFWVQAIPGDL
jgi:hypothetical protein